MVRFCSLVGRVYILPMTNEIELIVVTVSQKLEFLGRRALLIDCVAAPFRDIQTM